MPFTTSNTNATASTALAPMLRTIQNMRDTPTTNQLADGDLSARRAQRFGVLISRRTGAPTAKPS